MTAVNYTINEAVGPGGVTIGYVNGSFSVDYSSGSPVLASVSIFTPTATYSDVALVNRFDDNGSGNYYLSLRTAGVSGVDTEIMYHDAQDGTGLTIVNVTNNGSPWVSSDPGNSFACFTPNTLISTPTGSTPVKDLHIGDLILNHQGQSVPVKWIGRQRFHPAFAGESLPICIRQGALGNDLPLRDLFVSPGHALYIDNCLLIDAKALVNGTTITQVTQWEGDVQYLHIETEHHEIILAEGTPAETFMDNVSRTCFNNYSEYESLYPQATEMIELDIPRVSHQRQLPNAVKNKLEVVASSLLGDQAAVKAA
ncbi:Hint domain-containing protein [Polynucleobacter sp. JS-JIR-II-c23]|uniref:Hint domain-containing protein n=1 Tax=Polynucleobacter sp. JS-JIR-II-c23 TaxID=1758393 RepID=UPI002B23A81F|nr:Hint domain-containing protein [Polynucleobacter sp. JS-JIR-II-c23]MEA9603817.1 Hint domain-containing protein [Polynucleobacter sp. JS-JIR-II-c23]